MTQASELRGTVLGRGYRLDRPLGISGNVYEARHDRIPGRFVIRLFPDETLTRPEAVSRIQRSSRLASALRDPHVVQLVDYNIAGEAPAFVVLELVPGLSLAAAMREDGMLPLPRAVEIVDAIAAALDAGHRLGLVHGDLSPSHVFLPGTAGEPVARLTGFGWAKELRAASRFPPPSGYLAPEQDFGKVLAVDAQVDQFGLAALAYETIAGCLPFSDESADLAEGQGLARVPPAVTDLVPGCPAGVDEVLRQALATNPANRFAGVIQFAEQLRQAARMPPARRRVSTQSFGAAPDPARDVAEDHDLAGEHDDVFRGVDFGDIASDDAEVLGSADLEPTVITSADSEEKTVIRTYTPPPDAMNGYSDQDDAMENERTQIRPSPYFRGNDQHAVDAGAWASTPPPAEPAPPPAVRRGPPPGRAGVVPRGTGAHAYSGGYAAGVFRPPPLRVPPEVSFEQAVQMQPSRRLPGKAVAVIFMTAALVAGGGIYLHARGRGTETAPPEGGRAAGAPPARSAEPAVAASDRQGAGVQQPKTDPATNTTRTAPEGSHAETTATSTVTANSVDVGAAGSSGGTTATPGGSPAASGNGPATTEAASAKPTEAPAAAGGATAPSPADVIALAELPKSPPARATRASAASSRKRSTPSPGSSRRAAAAVAGPSSPSRTSASARHTPGRVSIPASAAPSAPTSSWARSASAERAGASAGGGSSTGTCAVSIGSRPWAHVWIDGRDTGVSTPVRDFKLPCGRHKLELKRPDQDLNQMEMIQVEHGRTFKRTYELE